MNKINVNLYGGKSIFGGKESPLESDELSYNVVNADLDLCYKQLISICERDHSGVAVMSVPPKTTDFDIQFSAAFDELAAYRATKLTPSDIADLRKERCLKCDYYTQRYNGVCVSCRWKLKGE